MIDQTNQLRVSFDKMSRSQQKAFIDELRTHLKGGTNSFLEECIQKYNAESSGDGTMASSKIKQYRIAFDKMPTEQKKIFIEKLRKQLECKDNPEYGRFLIECNQKYNMIARAADSSENSFENLLDDLPVAKNTIAEPASRLIAYFIDELLYLPMFILIYVEPCDWLVGYGMAYLIMQMLYWKNGTSFGKSRMKLYVVNKETGKTLSMGYMVLREVIGKAVSALVLLLGFAWILIDKDKQAWHDKLVSSIVVKGPVE